MIPALPAAERFGDGPLAFMFILRKLDKVVGMVARVNLSRAAVGNHTMAGHVRNLAEEYVSRPCSKGILAPGTTRYPGGIELHQT